MFHGGHLKRRISQYAALWLGAFLLSGGAILIATLGMDLMVAADLILPVMLALTLLALGAGVVLSLISPHTLGTKLAVFLGALILVLPLLWAPVSAAVVIAFFADRSIEYSTVYADFRIGISRVLYPATAALFGGGAFNLIWGVFQAVASFIGFVAAVVRIWPLIRRLLGPEPASDLR
ncbi:MAG: hypothetical protein ACI8U3_000347 [Brevundimonas sp.]|jgi:hypothetical protein|uniref:hypothetical protein n=1 Tax=Brevundimonas sp. TaxID=1871086 RepID=UPI0039E5A791